MVLSGLYLSKLFEVYIKFSEYEMIVYYVWHQI
jgi:hypothetical protein